MNNHPYSVEPDRIVLRTAVNDNRAVRSNVWLAALIAVIGIAFIAGYLVRLP